MKSAALLFVALSLIATSPVAAQTIKGKYPACQTEAYFDQMIKAVARDDTRGIGDLLQTGQCMIVKPGLQVSVLQTRGVGAVKIRVYLNAPGVDPSLDLWTFKENIQ